MMSTLRDVALEAGVSLSTASCVVNRNKRVSPDLTSRVEAAILKLGYRPNCLARGLRTSQTFTLGLVTSDIANFYYADVARGVEDRAEREGYSLFLCNTDADPRREDRYVQTLRGRQVDGIVFTSIRRDDHSVQQLCEEGFPLVLINRRVEGFPADYVGTDNVRGAVKAVGYLVALGHRRIGFIGGATLSTASLERREGYLKALHQAGLEPDPALMPEGDLRQETGYSAGKALLTQENRPTAIFAANDLMAFGVIEAAAELGLDIPGDLSLVGFDDNRVAALHGLQLTTIRQPGYDMGRLAAEILLEKIRAHDKERKPKEFILPCDLVVRRTTAPPRERKG
jgi:LacI family transcriptional regulator